MGVYRDSETHKECRDCGEVKPRSAFFRHPTNSDGIQSYCKTCTSNRSRKAAKDDPEKHAKRSLRNYHKSKNKGAYKRRMVDYNLRTRHGVGLDEKRDMLALQDNRCYTCGDPLKTTADDPGDMQVGHVDHCHDTGEVRGILCPTCNKLEGLLKKKGLAVARKILAYVDNPPARDYFKRKTS